MLVRVFTSPAELFRGLAVDRPNVYRVWWRYVWWIGLIPPVCAYLGVTANGWHLGVGEPIVISHATNLKIAALYYLALLVGYGKAVFLTRWMAPTYGASDDLGLHAVFVAIVGTPLMVGGVLHLYPLLPLNLLCLIPAILWSCYLLYTGIPALFGIDVERGMLMASAVLGVLLVAVLALAALTMIVWTLGLGPDIGFDWRSSVSG